MKRGPMVLAGVITIIIITTALTYGLGWGFDSPGLWGCFILSGLAGALVGKITKE